MFKQYKKCFLIMTVPEVTNCTKYAVDLATSVTTLSSIRLSTGQPFWPGFRISIIEKPACLASPYKLSADMIHVSHTRDWGHVGMMYNVKDVDNFDYVYFR